MKKYRKQFRNKINAQVASQGSQTKIARNSPCPCGSGKKLKNCHIDIGWPVEVPIEQTFLNFVESLQSMGEKSKVDDDELDRLFADPNLSQYMEMLNEVRENVEFALLSLELPDTFSQLVYRQYEPGQVLKLLPVIAACLGFNDYEIINIDIHKTELGPVLSANDFSFDTHSLGEFEILLHHDKNLGYAPQYVDDRFIFSQTQRHLVKIPMIHHSHETIGEFFQTQSSLHEVLHVMQRILRKNPIPHYYYPANECEPIRNPEDYVRIGVEDEVEVQKILVLAGYEVSLNPILNHKKNLLSAFSRYPPSRRDDIIRNGVESICWNNYAALLSGHLREAVLEHYCGLPC